jgi:hypothetical protein
MNGLISVEKSVKNIQQNPQQAFLCEMLRKNGQKT